MAIRGGWVLLHSAWELAAVAGGLALALRLLRSASARARYSCATVALALMFAFPLITFQVIAGAPGRTSGTAANSVAPKEFAAGLSAAGPHSPAPETSGAAISSATPRWGKFAGSWSIRIAGALADAAPWLIPLWGAGVLILCVWNLGGWVATQRLRRLGVRPVGAALVRRASGLAARIGVSRPVQLVESSLVQVPVVIGFVRPMVLLPTSILTGLPPQHLAAILAHELAHIRRHDYVVNLLQILVETLLFYHPAIWWVSRRIRIERENCCDDIAAGTCASPRAYAEALVCVEEMRPPGGLLAMAATGGGNMVARIQRLVGRPVRPRRETAGVLAAIILSLGLLLVPLAIASAETGPTPTGGTASGSPGDPPPAPNSNPAAAVFEKAFPYSIGYTTYQKPWSGFSHGDLITIRAIRGNRPKIEVGGSYAVMGTYALSSIENAKLGLFVTTEAIPHVPTAPTRVRHSQLKRLGQGSGTFVLWFTMAAAGDPHVSFYPTEPKAEQIGGVYFAQIPMREFVAAGHDPEIGRPIFKHYLDRNAQVEIGDPIFKNFIDDEPGSPAKADAPPAPPDAGVSGKPSPTIEISIGENQAVSVNGTGLADDQLAPRLREAHSVAAGTAVLVMDDETYNRAKLKLVMDACLKAGLTKIILHQSTVVIGIDTYGVVSINRWHVTDANVEPMLVQAHNANAEISVLIDAAAGQSSRRAFVMDSCRKAGLTKFIVPGQ